MFLKAPSGPQRNRHRVSSRHVCVTKALLLCLGSVACDSPADGADGGPIVLDSAGVEIVLNSGRVPQHLLYQVDLELGVLSGDPDFEFGSIESVGLASDGTIYALDSQASVLRIFSADGQAIATVGGAGEGPHEFSLAVGGLVVLPGDTLLIHDWLNRRFARLDKHGEWLEPISITSISVTSGRKWAAYGPGRLVFQGLPRGREVLMGLDLASGVVDTLLVLSEAAAQEAARAGVNMLLPRWLAWTPLGGGRIAWGWSDVYRIHVQEADGTLLRVISRDLDPVPIGTDDRDVLTETWLDLDLPAGTELPSVLTAVSFGDSWPLFSRFLAGPDETLWVQHVPVADELDREALRAQDGSRMVAREWDVFNGTGRFVGVAELPLGVRLYHVGSDGVYGVRVGSLGVETIVRLVLQDG